MGTTLKTLEPIASNPLPLPIGTNFGTMVQWQEAQAQVAVFNKNRVLADNYVNVTFKDWLTNYSGGKIPFDSIPSNPPVRLLASVIEESFPNGGTQVTWDAIDDPKGVFVCEIPMYPKMSPPQVGVSLMGLLRSEASSQEAIVPMVEVGVGSTALDGQSKWVRIQ